MIGTILLAVAGASAASEPAAQGWKDGTYTIEVSSWGQTTTHFAVNPDGTADVWQFRQPEGAGFNDFEVAKYRATVPAEARASFETEVGKMISGKIAKPKCKDPVHDAPSTEIHWGERQTFGVYHGCLDKKSKAFNDRFSTLIGSLRAAMVLEPTPYEDWSKLRDTN